MTECHALIFDVDGTLADTEELHRQAFNRAFAECRLDWAWDAGRYRDLLQVTGGKERISSYIAQLRLPPTEHRCLQELVPEIHRAKTRAFRELISNGEIKLRGGVKRLMLEARRTGVRLAIASTTSPENIEPLVIGGLGRQAMGWFEAIAAGDVVAHKKPAPDIYNVALETLNVCAACAIAFEDSAIGVQSATSAGLFTVVTPSVWTRGQDFAAASLLLESLEDVGLEQLKALHAAARIPVGHA
jgi:beta-phosphoglucomutase-like phosphatase (HAD superfamily)